MGTAPGRLPISNALFGVSLAIVLGSCTGSGTMDASVDAQSVGSDLFMRAAQNVPGGVFLGVWVPTREEALGAVYGPNYAFIAGGYLGVNPADIPAGSSAGRLLGYDGDGHFTTVCRTSFVIRSITGNGGLVYAVGDQPTMLRYTPSTGACDMLPITGAPADTSLRALAWGADTMGSALYLAGSSGPAESPTAAFYRFDGMQFAPVTVPDAAHASRLNSISFQPTVGFWVAGDHGALLRLALSATSWEYVRPDVLAPGTDDLLTSISTDSHGPRYWSMAVGGDQHPIILARNNSTNGRWVVRAPDVTNYPPSGGVLLSTFVQIEYEAYMVGRHATNVVFTGQYFFVPNRPLLTDESAQDDLLAVNGSMGNVVIAVGGDPANTTATQHGDILIRYDFPRHETYTVDGVSYPAFGTPRTDLPGRSEQSG